MFMRIFFKVENHTDMAELNKKLSKSDYMAEILKMCLENCNGTKPEQAAIHALKVN